MKATELIRELARGIAWVGDHEVFVEVQDCDGHDISNQRSGPVTFVSDLTYEDRPFRIISRKMVAGLNTLGGREE